MLDDLIDLVERDQVAEPFLGAEDGDPPALVVGRVGAPVLLVGDRRGAQVGVVHDGPFAAGVGQVRGELRFPDAFGEPCSTRPPARELLQLVGHSAELADPVPGRDRGKDRLVVATAEKLHLVTGHEFQQGVEERGTLAPQPLQQRA